MMYLIIWHEGIANPFMRYAVTSSEELAKRKVNELQAKGIPATYKEVERLA